MGVLHLITFTLFVIGSFALRDPKYQHLQSEIDNGNMHIPYGGKHWVVLVAGSAEWRNYRHQADICHAYQIVRRNGIPEENIITMMVDDIAYNSENPTPGMIINKPNGTDVYGGVVIDYKGDDVNVENFINIITGNKTGMHSIGTGKVVEGGIHDTVFINFVDHGSTGLLGFPNEHFYADQLIDALNYMHETRNYEKILLYIESCRSGSMFDGILNENKKILAVTASGPRENSWGCYCNSESEPYNTCLGDLFSVTWMESLDATVFDCSTKSPTVFDNFIKVRTNVTQSNVMVYGDFKIGHFKFSTFIGKPPCMVESTAAAQNVPEDNEEKITVSNRDAGEKAIRYQLLMDENLTDLKKHQLEMKMRLNNRMRSIIDNVFKDIYSEVKKLRPDMEEKAGEVDEPKHLKLDLNVFPCYRSILNKITESCFSLPRNPYSLERLTIFANLCVIDKQIHQTVEKVVDKACLNIPKNIKNVF